MSAPNLDMHGVAMPESPLQLPSALPELATKAMQRFSCTGTSCEDTCCKDFGISIDRESLERMRAVVARDPVRKDKVVRLVVLGMSRDAASSQNLVQLDDHGGCPLMESDGACGIHRHYGERILSTTCSIFPRTALAVEGRLEVTGSLACPELARLSLLADDGLDQDPSSTPVLPRAYVGKVLDSDPLDLYVSAFSSVRSVLLRLFERDDYPIGSRMAFAANLAAQVDEFFGSHRSFATHAERLMVKRRLAAELDAAEDSDGLRSLHQDLQQFQGGGEAVVSAAVSMLLERRRLTHSPRFGKMMEGAMARLQADCLGTAPGEETNREQTVTSARLWQVDQRRRARLHARSPGLADRILGRYARHYILRNAYTDATSLLSYLGRLSSSLATIRLLWTAMPELDAQWERTPEPGADARVASANAIHVIQTFTKTVSHHVEFLNAVHQMNDQPGGATFGRLVLIAKFI